ncbi:MAG: hypothetical protein EOO13_08195 [Chitinophagaceae bacterium]|nr:MAG: hypothetical protein EOO13_08195 [Chitinophagaceae bacterium]
MARDDTKGSFGAWHDFIIHTSMTFFKMRALFSLLVLSLFLQRVEAQAPTVDSGNYVRMAASSKYHKGKIYRKLWGQHYRTEWHTPVLFKKTKLDSLAGGLDAYEMGGGRQTLSLRLKDKNEREYVLRSIDKTLTGALPKIARGTFLESIANDQVSFSHPYAPQVVASLAEVAGVYHTNPITLYVPQQRALKQYNDSIGNSLYLFEERPDGNWETNKSLANSANIVGTKKMLENILEDNDDLVAQEVYLRARLFDMLIGDWGRHEDQWRWAVKEDGKKKLYYAIPRDRDNAFTKMDGLLLGFALGAADGDHMESFGSKIKDVPMFNFTARNMDHHLLTSLNGDQWKAVAADLQSRLTDAAIENAVKQLPPEIYPLSGKEWIAKLKSRRDALANDAATYYRFLAKEVEVTGSQKNEFFEITSAENSTTVNIYKIEKDGDVKKKALYSRSFLPAETKEIRLYGIAGKDEFQAKGNETNGIKVRWIGSAEDNTYTVARPVAKAIYVYDDKQADLSSASGVHPRLSSDSAVTRYKYDYFNYDKKGFKPLLFYSNFDRIYTGIAYNTTKEKWRKKPFGAQHHIDVKYSFEQQAISSNYYSIFPGMIGKWDLNLYGDFDQVRWRNFYGLGNQNLINSWRNFNRVRSRELLLKAGLARRLSKQADFFVNGLFQSYDVLNDTGRVLAKVPGLQEPGIYDAKQYAGAEIGFVFMNVNNKVFATKGMAFYAGADGLQNLKESSVTVMHYTSRLELFQPLGKKFGLRFSAAGATLTGKPTFYQYNSIGGTNSMRGYQRNRYYGNSSFASQNELRFLPDFRSRLFNGKLGVFGFYDFGRVWLKNEDNNDWHTGYGGGVILVPFNKIAISASYGVSKDDNNFHFDIVKTLF